MSISDYLRNLRAKVGHDAVMMPGVVAVVIDNQNRVLVQRSTDDGQWYLVGGAMDPGEEPAEAIVREVFEETGVHVVPERLVSVLTEPTLQYPNGDQVNYVSINFLCRPVGGEPHPNDDESLEVGFFTLDELPPLGERDRMRIEQALSDDPRAYFRMPQSAAGR